MKQLARNMFPNVYLALKARTGRLYLQEVNQIILRKLGSTVAAGPFKGMKYIAKANSSALAPKLLGTYERELHRPVAEIQADRYERIIDVGCAEGYYAVGLALTMPGTRVSAFDIDPAALLNLRELAAINGVTDRIDAGSRCDTAELERLSGKHCLVICDIEGAELDLLDPLAAPSLRGFDILVEIHDGPDSRRIHDTLENRFSPTHDLQFIPYAERRAEDCPRWFRGLPHASSRQLAVEEFRTYGIEWGYFRVKQSTRAKP